MKIVAEVVFAVAERNSFFKCLGCFINKLTAPLSVFLRNHSSALFKYRVSSQKVDEITIIANLQFVSEARGVFKGLKTLRKRMYVYKPSTSNIKIVKMTLDFEF